MSSSSTLGDGFFKTQAHAALSATNLAVQLKFDPLRLDDAGFNPHLWQQDVIRKVRTASPTLYDALTMPDSDVSTVVWRHTARVFAELLHKAASSQLSILHEYSARATARTFAPNPFATNGSLFDTLDANSDSCSEPEADYISPRDSPAAGEDESKDDSAAKARSRAQRTKLRPQQLQTAATAEIASSSSAGPSATDAAAAAIQPASDLERTIMRLMRAQHNATMARVRTDKEPMSVEIKLLSILPGFSIQEIQSFMEPDGLAPISEAALTVLHTGLKEKHAFGAYYCLALPSVSEAISRLFSALSQSIKNIPLFCQPINYGEWKTPYKLYVEICKHCTLDHPSFTGAHALNTYTVQQQAQLVVQACSAYAAAVTWRAEESWYVYKNRVITMSKLWERANKAPLSDQQLGLILYNACMSCGRHKDIVSAMGASASAAGGAIGFTKLCERIDAENATIFTQRKPRSDHADSHAVETHKHPTHAKRSPINKYKQQAQQPVAAVQGGAAKPFCNICGTYYHTDAEHNLKGPPKDKQGKVIVCVICKKPGHFPRVCKHRAATAASATSTVPAEANSLLVDDFALADMSVLDELRKLTESHDEVNTICKQLGISSFSQPAAAASSSSSSAPTYNIQPFSSAKEKSSNAPSGKDEVNMATDAEDTRLHLLDSGASISIEPNVGVLTNIKDMEIGKSIRSASADAKPMYATQTGVRPLGKLTERVWLSPDTRHGLTSVSAITAMASAPLVLFDAMHAFIVLPKTERIRKNIYDAILRNSHVQCIFKRQHDLYLLAPESAQANNTDSLPAPAAPELSARTKRLQHVYVMHVKLGHLAYSTLRHMVDHNIARGAELDHLKFPWSAAEMRSLYACESCALTKISDHAHKPVSSRKPAVRPLEHLFFDASGKITLPDISADGHIRKLWILFDCWQLYDIGVDAYSKRIFIEIFPSKDRITAHRITLIRREQRRLNTHLAHITADRGTETNNTEFKDFCTENGIQLELTPTNHKQLLGQVERYQLTVRRCIDALTVHANLHVVFNGPAARYAEALINARPVRSEPVSRAEKHGENQPNIERLQPFGCDCIVRREQGPKKPEERGIPAVFLGLTRNTEAAYDCLFLTNGEWRIVSSTRVNFAPSSVGYTFTFWRQHIGRRPAFYTPPRPLPSADPSIVPGTDNQPIVDSARDSLTENPPSRYATAPSSAVEHLDSESSDSEDEVAARGPMPTPATSVPDTGRYPSRARNPTSQPFMLSGSEVKRILRREQHVIFDDAGAAIGADHGPGPPPAPRQQIIPTAAPSPTLALLIDALAAACVVEDEYLSDFRSALRASASAKRGEDGASSAAATSTAAAADSVCIDQLYSDFAEANLSEDGPFSFKQFECSPERAAWEQAKNDELGKLRKLQVYAELKASDVPSNARIIDSRYVFVKKIFPNAPPIYKARLCAKDFAKKHLETVEDIHARIANFAPVVKTKNMRLMVILSTIFHLTLQQFDVNSAFLNAYYKRTDVFVRPPKGFFSADIIWRLKRPLYGMQDAPREWYDEMSGYLKQAGWNAASKLDPCLFWAKMPSSSLAFLVLHVDDSIAAVPPIDLDWWVAFKKGIDGKYGIKDLGVPKYCLGIDVAVTAAGISLHQQAYIERAIERFGLTQRPSVLFPELESNKNLRADNAVINADPTAKKIDDGKCAADGFTLTLYQQMIGTLLYASIMTRPDIAHAVQLLSSNMGRPVHADFLAAQRVLQYLKGTADYGLCFPYTKKTARFTDALRIECFTDADFAGDRLSSRSTTGVLVRVNNCNMHWYSKQQPYVTRSTFAAEWVAMSQGTDELIYLQQVLRCLGLQFGTPTLLCDNASSVTEVRKLTPTSSALRSVRVSEHQVQEEVNAGRLVVEWMSGKTNVADIFTKTLTKQRFLELRDSIVTKAFA